MEQNNSISLIHMFPYPVFLVKDGKVFEKNRAAMHLNIPENISIQELIITGSDFYQELKSGCLSLSLYIQHTEFLATVLRTEDYDIFYLENQDPESSKLQAMALAASQLRHPLSDVATSAELLFTDLKPTQRERFAYLNRGIMQLLRILGNMSDAQDYAHRTYHMEMLDAAAVIREAVEAAQAHLSAGGRKLKFRNSGQELITWADREMLDRAVYNLISNAIKYSPANTDIRAVLEVQATRLIFRIENTCTTMTPEQLGSIFFRYTRMPMIEPGEHGIGLGIPLIRSAAAAHGGTLLLDQPDSRTVRFSFTVAKRPAKQATLGSSKIHVDASGGKNACLMELSDVLPANKYND